MGAKSMRTSATTRTGVVLAIVMALGLWWVLVHDHAGDQDVAHQRAIFARFAVYPGATKIDEETFELKADGRGLGSYSVRIVYQLPPEARSSDVIGFYRAQMPAGWAEASDSTCTAAVPVLPAPSGAVQPSASDLGTLMFRRSQLTIFTSTTGTRVNGRYDGLTIELSNAAGTKTMAMDGVHFGCGTDTSDAPADRFDS